MEIICNKMPVPKFGSWVVEPMSELSRFIISKVIRHYTWNLTPKMWIGCLGPLIAFLLVFDASKQILNSSLASLIVMSLHQAFGTNFRHIFPSHFILSNCYLILACHASGCLWIASRTRVISGSKLKVKGPLIVQTGMHIRKCFKNPLRSNRSRAGWKKYVWMRKNQTSVVQVSAPVAKGCVGRARSRLLAAFLRLQDGVLRVFQYHVMFYVNGLHLQGS